MGERKVPNKYIPPDFDPSKIPRRKLGRKEDRQTKVRMMLPFSLRCNDCGNFIYKGTKFNATKETAEEDYLGLPIYRFHFRCPRCSNGLAMKTDPKNSDYVCELGATRNFEPWKEEERQAEGAKREREEEEAGDKMRELGEPHGGQQGGDGHPQRPRRSKKTTKESKWVTWVFMQA